MENQHRKISGYRELSQEEIGLINEIKALGPQIEDVVEKVKLFLLNQEHKAIQGSQSQSTEEMHKSQDDAARRRDATPERFAALAKTEFQTGLMYLTRAVAQPTFF